MADKMSPYRKNDSQQREATNPEDIYRERWVKEQIKRRRLRRRAPVSPRPEIGRGPEEGEYERLKREREERFRREEEAQQRAQIAREQEREEEDEEEREQRLRRELQKRARKEVKKAAKKKVKRVVKKVVKKVAVKAVKAALKRFLIWAAAALGSVGWLVILIVFIIIILVIIIVYLYTQCGDNALNHALCKMFDIF